MCMVRKVCTCFLYTSLPGPTVLEGGPINYHVADPFFLSEDTQPLAESRNQLFFIAGIGYRMMVRADATKAEVLLPFYCKPLLWIAKRPLY